MDFGLVKRGLLNPQKRRKWVMLLGTLGFSGYGVYRVYQSPSMIKKREKLLKLMGALISVAEAVSDTAEAIGVISKDLKEFVKSDSDQIPNSLRQVSKITRSDEFSEPVIKIVRALTVGILRGYRSEARMDDPFSDNPSVSDRILDKLFSTSGSGFASVIVGSFARNLVMGYYSEAAVIGRSSMKGSTSIDYNGEELSSPPQWVNVICSDKSRELVCDCVQLLVSTAVSAYLEKTMHINTYNEIFAGLTNPKHKRKMKEMLATVCNGAVETLIRTSNQVLNNPDSGNPLISIDEFESSGQVSHSARFKARSSIRGNKDSVFGNRISSSLAVPSNRKLVLDVTGRVTFETVKSFLEFLLDKMCESMRNSVGVVHEAVVERGIEAIRFVREQSSALVTICLTLCLHILGSVWILVPA